jgi:hypothetical protein
MLESGIERRVCDHAERTGWLVRKVAYIGRRGAPDRWFLRGGRLLLIEFKRPGCTPEPHQVREHARLMAAGFPVHVIDSIANGVALLDAS